MSKKTTMNILIVSAHSPELYTTKRLLKEAHSLKYNPLFITPSHLALEQIKPTAGGLFLHRTSGTNYDDFDLLVSQFYADAGFKVSNPLNQLSLFRSKDSQYLFFKRQNLAHIPTLCARGPLDDSLKAAIEKMALKNQQYILKMSRGNQGIGVNFINGNKSLYGLIETFHALKDQKYIIQPFVAHQKEWRLFMLKGEILASVERKIDPLDYRGNSKRTSAKLLKKIPSDLKSLAERAFSASGLDYSGLDILQNENGEYQILEMNAVPGFEQIEELSKLNVARELLIQLK